MFDQLTARLTGIMETLRGRGRITDENIAATLREARVALLEADVALPVVKSFIEAVRAKAQGAAVLESLTPGQAFIGILHQELITLMGGAAAPFPPRAPPPVVVLLAGLQGAGKTTTAAKLARLLLEREGKRVLLASTDVRRPAAMLQLERLAASVHAEYFAAGSEADPAAIARAALARARSGVFDVLIVDTAGRLHVDEPLMAEVRAIDAAAGAAARLFVVDAMAGQDAVHAARAFGQALDLTGIILTKADGDARGGVALSVRQVTGKPILFLGVGEKTEALEPFDAARMATRVLGMGDVVGLIEQAHRQVDAEAAARLARKALRGQGFDMVDLRAQLEQLQKLGGVGTLLEKLPGAAAARGTLSADEGNRQLRRQIAIINSMTPGERRTPALIDGSRRRRIAAGSGAQVQDVNRLVKQFREMQRVMKNLKGGRLKRLMGALKGGLPPGFPGGG